MSHLDLRAGPTHPLVWGRAVVVGSVAMATGVVSHVAGGGLLPGPVTMGLLLVGCVALTAGFLVRPVSTWTLTGLVVAGQGVAHAVLSATAGHRGDAPVSYLVTPPVVTADADVFDRYEQIAGAGHSAGVVPAPTVAEWLDAQVAHFAEAGIWMVVSHLVGAAVLGVFLAVGERALWRLVALVVVRRSVRRGTTALRTAAAGTRHGVRLRATLLVPSEPQVRGAQLLTRPVLRRRGPPFVLAA